VRLFLTCWIVYGMHFATDVIREHYPAVALGDDLTFRLDEYHGLHPDLFEKEGYGWHIGNNPGISLFAAIPYALSRPVIDPIVDAVRARRDASGQVEPPVYDTPWPNDRRFFAETWRRGLDVKLGLAAFVTHFFFMAPVCAAGVVLLFLLLRRIPGLEARAVWLALLYAFGTPLFYRAGFLNHNMVLGLIAFAAFVGVWDPGEQLRWSERTSFLVLGLAGGLTLLFDYSGAVLVLGLFAYGLARHPENRMRPMSLIRRGLWYTAGALPGLSLLWFYQWRSFGNPFLPGQHWMPPVRWIELGYQGYGFPQPALFAALGFDYRFGLFAFCPLLLLAFAAPFLRGDRGGRVPRLEAWFLILIPLSLWVFFAGSNYSWLQYNTGVRYLAPTVPFLFVASAATLSRMPLRLQVVIGSASVALMWCLSMYRDVELGVLDPVLRTLVGGFSLPALRTLERTGSAYLEFAADGVSPLPLMVAAAIVVAIIWLPLDRRERVSS
jgi:hypothetical protein